MRISKNKSFARITSLFDRIFEFIGNREDYFYGNVTPVCIYDENCAFPDNVIVCAMQDKTLSDSAIIFIPIEAETVGGSLRNLFHSISKFQKDCGLECMGYNIRTGVSYIEEGGKLINVNATVETYETLTVCKDDIVEYIKERSDKVDTAKLRVRMLRVVPVDVFESEWINVIEKRAV